MEVIFILIAISLILAVTFLFLFFRAMKNGQFDDSYTPSVRILFENQPKKSKKDQPKKTKSYE
jgi:cbb3-type cytochrome oxidase maturation protein